MESIIFDSAHFLLRWLHIITAIAWIGASFYFIWLDNSLEDPVDIKAQQGVSGDLWAFHGGGIYEVNKYRLSPPSMPSTLHWFKWEAYSTWITGALLLILFYYCQAELYLVGKQDWSNTPFKAICTSLVFLLSGFLLYELLVRFVSRKHPGIFLLVFIACVILLTWFASISFSGRAAYLHIGAMLATIMAANVLLGIMPAQRSFIRAIEQQQSPNADRMAFAKTRSVHNNYLTLPVLLCMVSNHYPLFFGSEHGWWILCVMMLAAAYARHFFNLRHKGIVRPKILVVALTVFVAIIIFLVNQQPKPAKRQTPPASQTAATPDETMSLASNDQAALLNLTALHCQSCHSASPTSPAFPAPPLGLTLDTVTELSQAKAKIITAVSTSYMPLGNMTHMSEADRQEFIRLMQTL
ncbi:hypothetical protein TDB9533_01577 [Thalassocella blandensis]|nr:hypothetical protein TDB9533_01577 [Thalassocella blandensis]